MRRTMTVAAGLGLVALGLVVSACGSEPAAVAPAATRGDAAGWQVSVAAGASALKPGAPAAVAGYRDGAATEAQFDRPVGMAPGPDGSIYIADSGNRRIRRLSASGQVETVAGSGAPGSRDGPALEATFRTPVDVAVGADGTLYIVDAEAAQVRSIRDGQVSTVAGVDVVVCVEATAAAKAGGAKAPAACPAGPGQSYRDGEALLALFNQPTSVAVAGDGTLYVADSSNQVVRAIAPGGQVRTVAGSPGTPGFADGRGAEARFFFPVDLAFGPGGALFLTEGSRLRRIEPSDGTVTTLAGSTAPGAEAAGYADGAGADARFKFASGLAVRADGTMYVADTGNGRLREVKPGGDVATAAGKGGQGMALGGGDVAQFSQPVGVVVQADGSVLLSDYNLGRIFRVRRPGPS